MTFPQILEVAIGLVLLYYVLGSVVSALTQLMMDSLEVRGRVLEMYLRRIFGDPNFAENPFDVLRLPQMQSLRPERFRNWAGIFTSATEPKKVERIPVPMLVNAFFDYVGLTELEHPSSEDLIVYINRLPESDSRQAMLKWVELGVTNIDHLRERVTEYFTGVMDAVGNLVSARSRSFMVMLALIITLALGIDSFQVAGELWSNSDLRAVSSAASNIATDKGGQTAANTAGSVDMRKLSIKIGWLANDYPVNASAFGWIIFIVLKILGLGVTMACVSQGSAFWFGLLKKLD